MKRSYCLEHQGKRIVFVDFSHTDFRGITQAIAEAEPLIAGQPPASVLCLVETFGTGFSFEISQAIKEFTLRNKPFMKMTAIVGLEGLQKIVLNSVIVFTKRKNLVTKGSRTDALDFLVAQ